jgi:hypothetical protein
MDNFEDFLKEQGDNFRIKPGSRVWDGIEAGLDKKRKKPVGIIVSGIAALLLLSTGIYFLAKPGKTNHDEANKSESKKIEKSVESTPDRKDAGKTISPVNAGEKEMITDGLRKGQQHFQASETKNTVEENPKTPEGKVNNVEINERVRNDLFLPDPNRIIYMAGNIQGVKDQLATVVSYRMDNNQQDAISKDNKPSKYKYIAEAGINLSHILSNYSSFIKPALGYQAELTGIYSINSMYSFGTGIQYRQTSYSIGAVTVSPYSQLVNNSYQLINYKLNNEVYKKNIIREISVPLNLYAQIWSNQKQDLEFNAGSTLAKTFVKNYLIKIPQSDKIFINNDFISPYIMYFNTGLTYFWKRKNGPEIVAGYKILFQLNNTYTNHLDLREHYFVQGLSLGLAF